MNATRETIVPESREAWLALRAQDLTSTTIPALFNASPWITRFELWNRLHRGVRVEAEINDAMKWGSRLEAPIAMGIAEDEGWQIRKKGEYMRLPMLRIGSSFDYEIIASAPELLEIKRVRYQQFRDGWQETDFGLEAPTAIEIQVAVEMMVSGIGVCHIGALTGDDTVHVLRRARDPEVEASILAACAAFWTSPEPEPDFLRDAAFIGSMYGYVAEGKTLDADDELVALFRQYAGYSAALKAAEDGRDACKAEILTRIGDAERVCGGEFTLSTKRVAAAQISYERKPYRSFSLKEKTK